MGLCTRTTTDPLLSELIRNRVNPLSIAREQSPLGTVYLITSNSSSITSQIEWQLKNVIDVPFEIKPREITTPPGLALEETSSSNLDIDTSMRILGRMLPGVSDPGKLKIRAALENAIAASCSFRIVEPSIQRLHVDELQMTLLKASFKPEFKAVLGGFTPYVCTGAWAAKSLELSTMDKAKRSLNLLAELDAILRAEGELGVHLVQGYRDRKLFKAKERLFFGAELMRLDQHQDGGLRLAGYNPRGMLADAGEAEPLQLDEIWSEEATVLLEFNPERP